MRRPPSGWGRGCCRAAKRWGCSALDPFLPGSGGASGRQDRCPAPPALHLAASLGVAGFFLSLGWLLFLAAEAFRADLAGAWGEEEASGR